MSSLYAGAGDPAAARAELVAEVNRQPQNPQTWLSLGAFDIGHHHPRRAYGPLVRALRLDPVSLGTIALVAQARTELGIPAPK